MLNEAVRDGIIARNPATDRARRRTVGRSFRSSEPSTPRDLALPNVAILEHLVARVVEAGNDQSWGDVVTILATRPPSGSVRCQASALVISIWSEG